MNSKYAAAYSSQLCIDLGAVRANYRTLTNRVAPARCGSVIKANAYGLDVASVGPALYREGCRDYFVAQLHEAIALARVVGADATIFILNGIDPGSEAACAERGFIPVLSSLSQIDRWRQFARTWGKTLPAALQIDSGMSRLGLPPAVAIALARDADMSREIDLRLIMTHLACADDPSHEANKDQLETFCIAQAHFPGIPTSIANSGGAFLPHEYHGDIARPGVALFGVHPNTSADGLRPVVSLDARVLQISEIEAGTGVGYGLTYIASAPRRVATIAIGYADGWPRNLGGVGAAWLRGERLPIIGRVSMDSLTIDISGLPVDALVEGDFVELVGSSQSLTDVARDAGTIAYEILTRIGPRHARLINDNGTRKIIAPGETL